MKQKNITVIPAYNKIALEGSSQFKNSWNISQSQLNIYFIKVAVYALKLRVLSIVGFVIKKRLQYKTYNLFYQKKLMKYKDDNLISLDSK